MRYLLVPQPAGKAIPLTKAVVLIGRLPDCDVILDDSERVSRRHCCLVQVDDRFVLRDLGSTNGVRHNGRLVDREAHLHVGDEIVVGDKKFLFTSKKAKPRSISETTADDVDGAEQGELEDPVEFG
jgi:pSer/pThr/pTyr-binding forkhead associated (FHA) protein